MFKFAKCLLLFISMAITISAKPSTVDSISKRIDSLAKVVAVQATAPTKVEIIKAPAADTTAKEMLSEAKRSNSIADSIPWSSWLASVASILALVVSIGIARNSSAQNRQDNQARDNLDKIKFRARVNINIRPKDIYIGPSGHEGFFQISIGSRFVNSGETAAESIVFQARIHTQPFGPEIGDSGMESDIAFHKKIGQNGTVTFEESPVPNSLAKGDGHTHSSRPLNMGIADFRDEHDPSKRRLMFYTGFIKYRDVFGDIWIRKFTWQVNMNEKHDRVGSLFLRRNEEIKDDTWPKSS